jgi:small subunit ribosomal protein S3
MVQKINPLGFRLGVTQNDHSHWFAQQRNYSKDLQEDKKIRTCIENYVRTDIKRSSNYGGIARVDISRKIDLIQVKIYIGFPKLLLIEGRGFQGIEKLKNDVLNMLDYVDRKLHIAIEKVAKPYRKLNILVEYIALQLEKRVPFRKTMKKVIELAEREEVEGIQIQIAGRLDGKEIA